MRKFGGEGGFCIFITVWLHKHTQFPKFSNCTLNMGQPEYSQLHYNEAEK